MCHCAAGNLLDGKNVLYITMEMAEEKIAERIDANLLDVTIDDLSIMPKETFFKKLERVKTKTTGRLIIKEYPTSGEGSANFRHLINELKLKKNFMPDIIYIDYLNICASSRVKYSANMNSYTYIKAIAEELRGLAVEFNLPIVSATQTTRSGFNNSDVELSDTSESFALPATADLMFALTTSEELESLGQIMVKQLKNRYNDLAKNKRFVVGVDRAKMKLYDVDQSAQDGIQDDKPLMDKTDFGERDSDFFKKRSKFGKSFDGFA
jgi:replicative DNA helicase